MKYINKTLIFSAVMAASISAAVSEETFSGKITTEFANFTQDGTTTGADSEHSKDSMKQEISARFYLDGDVNDNTTYHLEFQGYSNNKAVEGNDTNASYTQRDALREAYIDTTAGDWLVRAGKQQVVWGTADGMKLLDMINPTDYTEMAQNQMEDSRIPVLMLNVEKELENGGNIQAVISEPRENIFAGLNRNIDTSERKNGALDLDKNNEGTQTFGWATDSSKWGMPYAESSDDGHPFKLMGPDSITGSKNGFLNIVPDMGSVASQFGFQFSPLMNADHTDFSAIGALDNNGAADWQAGDAGGLLDPTNAQDGDYSNNRSGVAFAAGLQDGLFEMIDGNFANFDPMNFFTVGGFEQGTLQASEDAFVFMQAQFATTNALNITAEAFNNPANGYVNNDGTLNAANIAAATNGGVVVGELFTFNNFNIGNTLYGMAKQQLVEGGNANPANNDIMARVDVLKGMTGAELLDMFQEGFDSNLSNYATADKDSAFEYMDRATFTTFNAFGGVKSKYKYNMPSIEDGDADIAMRYKNTTKNGVNYSINYAYAYDKNPIINLYYANDAGEKLTETLTPITIQTANGDVKTNTIKLSDAAGNQYGAHTGNAATLVFEQETKRVHNLGGSFDMAIDTKSLGPVVIRGEALYMKDTYSPIMDLGKLSYGDLTGALTMRKGDRFKYVLGADITALTNMMVSVQFIQDRDLDYVNDNTDWDGTACAQALTVNCGRYTTSYPTMHLTNGFNAARENQNFYSLFLSKPFGASDQHRWNNIMMFEQGGGRWNRLDAEYAVNDNTVATIEWNKYWGENNTQFGQLKNSSNIQLGLKYSF